jgi:hypothetical protein
MLAVEEVHWRIQPEYLIVRWQCVGCSAGEFVAHVQPG